MGVRVKVGFKDGVGVQSGHLLVFMEHRALLAPMVLACARPALHRPALPCTPLHCALDMDSYCICRPPWGHDDGLWPRL